MIPGINVLGLAMGLITPQAVQWFRFTGRATNEAGYQPATYAAAVTIAGSVQPIPRTMYQALGLDLGKEYVTLFTPAGVVTVGRDESGDKITYDGKTFLCESSTDWKAQDGWASIVAVRIPQAAP